LVSDPIVDLKIKKDDFRYRFLPKTTKFAMIYTLFLHLAVAAPIFTKSDTSATTQESVKTGGVAQEM